MSRCNRQSAGWLKLLVFVFAMNASLGYSACCVDLDTAAGAADESCHETDTAADGADSQCCSACVVSMIRSEQVKPARALPVRQLSPLTLVRVPGYLDPPYRPPIADLS